MLYLSNVCRKHAVAGFVVIAIALAGCTKLEETSAVKQPTETQNLDDDNDERLQLALAAIEELRGIINSQIAMLEEMRKQLLANGESITSLEAEVAKLKADREKTAAAQLTLEDRLGELVLKNINTNSKIYRIKINDLSGSMGHRYLYSIGLTSTATTQLKVIFPKELNSTGTTHLHGFFSKENWTYVKISVTLGYTEYLVTRKIEEIGPDVFNVAGEVEEHLDIYEPTLLAMHQKLKIETASSRVTLLAALSDEKYRKDRVFEMTEKSTQDLYRSIEQSYDRSVKAELAKSYPFFSEAERKMAFIFQVVTNMFHYGNVRETWRVGCSQVNETYDLEDSSIIFTEYSDGYLMRWRTARNMSEYLTKVGDIGCCTDFAFILKAVLDRAGIPAKRHNIPGHWLVEAEVSGKTFVLDPSYGGMVDLSLKDMLLGKSRNIYLVPNRNIGHVSTFLVELSLSIGLTTVTPYFNLKQVIEYPNYIDWGTLQNGPWNNENRQVLGID